MSNATCKNCDRTFSRPDNRQGPKQVFCEKRCTKMFHAKAAAERTAEKRRKIREAATCDTCGVILAKSRTAQFCSQSCWAIARGVKRPEPYADRVCALPECSVVFTPYRDGQLCCCEQHGQLRCNRLGRADGRYKPTPWNEAAKNRSQRRRALKAGASTGVPVRFSEIASRDKWRCSICGGKVLKSKTSPHPLSPSLDHVIPLSLGGAHDPVNVALAHLRCNVTKSNRGGGEQLALIG